MIMMTNNNDQKCQQEKTLSSSNTSLIVCNKENDDNFTLNDFCGFVDLEASTKVLEENGFRFSSVSKVKRKRYDLSANEGNESFKLPPLTARGECCQTLLRKDEKHRKKLNHALLRKGKRHNKSKVNTSLDNPTKQTGTYVCDGRVNCFEHTEPVKYWCENCSSSRCEKCVNIMYSKICVDHDITPLRIHMMETKTLQQKFIEKTSTSCLQTADLLFKYINRDQAQMELRALARRERIRQEFISFYQFLEDEEQNILDRLDKRLEKYTTSNQLIEDGCGSLIEDEAELMSKTLDTLQIDDPYGTSVADVSNLINKEWKNLARNAKELTGQLQKCPDIIDVKLSFSNIKQTVKTRLSEVSESVKLVPVSYTIFLDGDSVFAPIKVSDLFSYEIDGQHCETPILLLDVEIRTKQQLIQKVQLRHDDHICNSKDKLYLLNGQSYRVHAVIDRTQQGKNVLIVTGHQPPKRQDSSILQHCLVKSINGIRRKYRNRCEEIPSLQFNGTEDNEIFCQWVDSTMWLFSCTSFCEGFFDVSPEEMRALAYCSDRPTYELIDAQLKRDSHSFCKHARSRHNMESFLELLQDELT